MAAVPGACPSPTSRAASAVELAATTSTPDRSRARKARHWAVACGIDSTRRTSATLVPGRASRLSCTAITISRWMSRSWSKVSVSRVTFTVPSMEFSTGATATSTSPRSRAARASGTDRIGTSSSPARSGWVNTASSLNVPGGPRNATLVMNEQDSEHAMDEPALRQLLTDVRAGVLSADEAVARLRRLPFADLGFARVDHHRELRQRLPEAVYAPGKTAEQCAALVAELLTEEGGGPVLLTRADDTQAD